MAVLALVLACTVQGPTVTVAPPPTPTSAPTSTPPRMPTPTLTPTPTSTPTAKLSVNLIAYVNQDGQIRTVDPNGAYTERISPEEGFFTWPMWSLDSSQIVFSGTTGSGSGTLALYRYRLGDDQPQILFTNEFGTGPILPGMPHYPIWAPDSGLLAFMASSSQGLTLFLTDSRAGVDAEVVLRNAPLYASWSADSQHLLVHGGADLFLVDVEGGVEDLGIRAPNYRVPAWWPSGNRKVFVSEDDDGKRGLYISDSEHETLLEEISEEVAFLWSPDGESLAVAHSELPGGLNYRGVTLFAPDGTRRQVAIRENVVAFFWSPDSTKLAYVTFSDSRESLRWMILDVVDGSRWPLVDFIPSGAQMTLFRFFDQFAYSHTLWSPDSDSLVFSGRIGGGVVSASFKPSASVSNHRN